MANYDNLTAHRFTSENQPKKRRSRRGIPNRSTFLRKWLKSKVTLPAHLVPNGLQGPQQGTIEDHMALALIARALRGNVSAIKEVLDTVYGKVTDKQELTGPNGEPITIIEAVEPIEAIKARFEAQRQERIKQIEGLDDDDGP